MERICKLDELKAFFFVGCGKHCWKADCWSRKYKSRKNSYFCRRRIPKPVQYVYGGRKWTGRNSGDCWRENSGCRWTGNYRYSRCSVQYGATGNGIAKTTKSVASRNFGKRIWDYIRADRKKRSQLCKRLL